MRVLVCGGRDYSDYEKVKEVLDGIRPTEIIHGNARGADTLGGDYARSNGIECREYPADWDAYGRRAGYVRNSQMLVEGRPELVVAFPGGKGTEMMIKLAKSAGVAVYDCR
jgi:hypothetical protein